jgi:hypothetical protein
VVHEEPLLINKVYSITVFPIVIFSDNDHMVATSLCMLPHKPKPTRFFKVGHARKRDVVQAMQETWISIFRSDWLARVIRINGYAWLPVAAVVVYYLFEHL